MKKNIWFIMGGAIVVITFLIIVVQGWVIITLLSENRQSATPALTQTSIAAVQRPLFGEPRVDARTPLKPRQEAGISIGVSIPSGIRLTYTWHADGGEIVRGQGSPAITYRAPDESGVYNVRVVVKWDGQSAEETTSIKVEEEPTPTPPSQSPTGTSVPPTGTPVPPTDTPTAISTPMATPALSPDAARTQLAPFDQQMQEFDEWIKQTQAQRLERDECRSYIGEASGECWIYPIGMGNVILVEGYTYFSSLFEVDVYAYDFDGAEQPEILKWDLERDGCFDMIEYDVDGDSVFDFALADMNTNGQFDEDEIYMYQSTTRRYQPLVSGALPFPFLPIFPY